MSSIGLLQRSIRTYFRNFLPFSALFLLFLLLISVPFLALRGLSVLTLSSALKIVPVILACVFCALGGSWFHGATVQMSSDVHLDGRASIRRAISAGFSRMFPMFWTHLLFGLWTGFPVMVAATATLLVFLGFREARSLAWTISVPLWIFALGWVVYFSLRFSLFPQVVVTEEKKGVAALQQSKVLMTTRPVGKILIIILACALLETAAIVLPGVVRMILGFTPALESAEELERLWQVIIGAFFFPAFVVALTLFYRELREAASAGGPPEAGDSSREESSGTFILLLILSALIVAVAAWRTPGSLERMFSRSKRTSAARSPGETKRAAEAALQERNIFEAETTLTPLFQGRALTGMKLGALPKEGNLLSMGFKEGDVLKAINKMPLNDIKVLRAAFNSGKAVTIDCLRNGALLNWSFMGTNEDTCSRNFFEKEASKGFESYRDSKDDRGFLRVCCKRTASKKALGLVEEFGLIPKPGSKKTLSYRAFSISPSGLTKCLGLQDGDLVTKIAGKTFFNERIAFASFMDAINTPGTTIELLRGANKAPVQVTSP
jgi:hypothetical protein